MVTGFGLRPFRRSQNEIMIHLNFEEWPTDVPLPPGARIHELGDGPYRPYWLVRLKPELTIEAVFGWFDIPCLLNETVAWYSNEMDKLGWTRDTKGDYQMEDSAALNFHHPQLGIRIEVRVTSPKASDGSFLQVRRILQHPYPPPDESEAEAVADSAELPPLAVPAEVAA